MDRKVTAWIGWGIVLLGLGLAAARGARFAGKGAAGGLPPAGREEVRLNFAPLPVQRLAAGPEPGQEWQLSREEGLALEGGEEAAVRIYTGPGGAAAVFLANAGSVYAVGLPAETEPEKISAAAADVNGDGRAELIVTADLGATCKAAKVLAYSGEAAGWMYILDTENLVRCDIDNTDGPELLTTSMGSLPGYVWLYRWEGDHFAKADVAADTGSEYALLIRRGGRNYLQAGKPGEAAVYEYRGGESLIRADMSPSADA